MVKDSLAQIAPADTAIGPPTATARRLVNASVSTSSAGSPSRTVSRITATTFAPWVFLGVLARIPSSLYLILSA